MHFYKFEIDGNVYSSRTRKNILEVTEMCKKANAKLVFYA